MFNKANGRQETSRRDHNTSPSARHMSIPDTRKEEFIDWPESLLSIGTFGTSALKEVNQKCSSSNNKNVEQDLSNFTSEEVATLVKELENMGLERGNSTMDRFMDCSTSLTNPNYGDGKKVLIDSKIVLSKERELLDDTSGVLKKRPILYLLKKLVPTAPARALRDPFPQSRMEKLLKSILRKKIYPQKATATPTKKYLERKHQELLCMEEEAAQEKGDDAGKWVKTDSEYIVLEI